jgi:hypothetical protein
MYASSILMFIYSRQKITVGKLNTLLTQKQRTDAHHMEKYIRQNVLVFCRINRFSET